MDKALAQTMILLCMLGLASLTSTVYLGYVGSNTPQSQGERQLYTQTAASLFYAEIYGLISDPNSTSYFLHVQPKPTLTGWVCADFYYFSWRAGGTCSDMSVKNQTITRSFAPTFYNYYTVMAYVPPGAPALNLTFDWWVSVSLSDGAIPPMWIWFGAFLSKGDALPYNDSFNIVASAPFYYASNFYGTRSGTFRGLLVPAGYTLIISLSAPPNWLPGVQYSYGFTVEASPQNTLSVILPSKYYEASISQPNGAYNTEPGPVANFTIRGTLQGQLKIYYNNTLVAEENTTFMPGEDIIFYPDPAYPQTPEVLLLFNYPIQVNVSGGRLTVSYVGTSATIGLDAILLGGGTSSAWSLRIVGCQKACVVAVEPAQTKQ